MIIWLNGAFGAGKTTTARHLAGRLENARLFDAELVGYLLMAALDDHEFQDFQDLPPWRELVPVVTEAIAGFTGQHLTNSTSRPANGALTTLVTTRGRGHGWCQRLTS